MIILGIETSCDETAAAVLEQKNDRIQILSNIIASSSLIQAKYGGVIPEQAAREQLKAIIPVIKEALEQASLNPSQIDALAVTQGPGLIGSLLVGVETAKTLSLIWSEQSSYLRNKPLIPVNHLIGHFYANWISEQNNKLPMFPSIGLLVSGGHTDIVLFKNHGNYRYLGGTRDDAAGECFDKCARVLGFPYPGGPQISKLARNGDSSKIKLPRPMLDSGDFDFSFSGLKTAFANLVEANKSLKPEDLASALEESIAEVLVKKVVRAAKTYKIEQIIVAGGVAANQRLREVLIASFEGKISIPSPSLCTDNAAMIASAAFFQKPIGNPLDLQANPNLSL